jgi:hypothetical protein
MTAAAISDYFKHLIEAKKGYKVAPVDKVRQLVPVMEALGVSNRAREPDGFLSVFLRENGNITKLSTMKYPGKQHSYMEEREHFIKRHYKQFKKLPTVRHYLALAAWAFIPNNAFIPL